MTRRLEDIDFCFASTDVVERNNIPSEEECLGLLRGTFEPSPGLIRHSMKVAQTAVLLGKILNQNGSELDLKLIEASSLLHDMARGIPNHARVAGGFLRKLGYADVARVVEAHMDPLAPDPENITEIDIVALSDRLVMGDQVVPLKVRFKRQLLNYGEDPEAKAMIHRRFCTARVAQSIVEENIGMMLAEVFPELSE